MKRNFVAAAALLLGAGLVQAQGYFGLSGGASHTKVDCAGTTSCDNNGNGFKVFGGYKFMPGLAGELVYLNFGKATAAGSVGAIVVNTEIKTNAMGGGIAAAGNLTPNVPATARLGAARVKAKGTGSSGAISFSESDTTTQAYFGLDIGYAFSKAAVVTLSADFSRSEISGDTGSVRLIGVGFTFNF